MRELSQPTGPGHPAHRKAANSSSPKVTQQDIAGAQGHGGLPAPLPDHHPCSWPVADAEALPPSSQEPPRPARARLSGAGQSPTSAFLTKAPLVLTWILPSCLQRLRE